MFSSELCEFFKNNNLYRTPPVAASELNCNWCNYNQLLPLIFMILVNKNNIYRKQNKELLTIPRFLNILKQVQMK